MSDGSKEPSEPLGTHLERQRELRAGGCDRSQAHGIAWLEQRIKEWPGDSGDDLQVLLYGDFEPPETDLYIQPLEITIHSEKRDGTIIGSSLCVLTATVSHVQMVLHVQTVPP